MNLVLLRYSTPRDFLRSIHGLSERRCIVQQTRVRYCAGDEVLLDIRFPGLRRGSVVQATVVSAGAFEAVFEPSEDGATTFAYVCSVALGGAPKPARAHRRYPAAIPVDCRSSADGMRTAARTEDISASGAFIASPDAVLPEVGSRVRLAFGPMANGRRYLAYAEVAWVREGRGFGVKFVANSNIELRVALRRATEKGHLSLAA